MTRTVAAKMGVKAGVRSYFANAPDDALKAMELPELHVSDRLEGHFGYIHLFARDCQDLDTSLIELKPFLLKTGMLWVSWPKGRQLGTDLTLPHVIRIGYNNGLVESTTLSVNTIWSAMKFTHPKVGKVYNNSYGKLPDR